MAGTALVTGTDRGLGLALVSALLDRGWTVVAGHLDEAPSALERLASQAADRLIRVRFDVADLDSIARSVVHISARVRSIDLLINNAGVLGKSSYQRTIQDGLDYEEALETVDVNAFGPLRVVERYLELMSASSLKRLCFVSSEASSVAKSHRSAWFGYCMSKSALNMGVSILFNDLRPKGFTFRLYHPGGIRSFMSGRENTQAKYSPAEAAELALGYFLSDLSDENRLVLRDQLGEEWTW